MTPKRIASRPSRLTMKPDDDPAFRALSPLCPFLAAHRFRLHFRLARAHAGVRSLRRNGPAWRRPRALHRALGGRNSRDLGRSASGSGIVHSARGVSALWPDGRRLLYRPRSPRILARPERRRTLGPLLLSVPLFLRSRRRQLQPRCPSGCQKTLTNPSSPSSNPERQRGDASANLHADGDIAGSIPNSFGQYYRSCVPWRLLWARFRERRSAHRIDDSSTLAKVNSPKVP